MTTHQRFDAPITETETRAHHLEVIARLRDQPALAHLRDMFDPEQLAAKSDDWVRACHDGALLEIERRATREREDAQIREDRAALGRVNVVCHDAQMPEQNRLEEALKKADADAKKASEAGPPAHVTTVTRKPS